MSQFQEKNLTVKEAVEKNKNEFIRYKTIRNERWDVRRNNIYTNRRQLENTTTSYNYWLYYI
jgi:hypothetical protein